jgi:hypothetical protein
MAIWDDWSTAKKTRAVIGIVGFIGLLLYAAVADMMGW